MSSSLLKNKGSPLLAALDKVLIYGILKFYHLDLRSGGSCLLPKYKIYILRFLTYFNFLAFAFKTW